MLRAALWNLCSVLCFHILIFRATSTSSHQRTTQSQRNGNGTESEIFSSLQLQPVSWLAMVGITSVKVNSMKLRAPARPSRDSWIIITSTFLLSARSLSMHSMCVARQTWESIEMSELCKLTCKKFHERQFRSLWWQSKCLLPARVRQSLFAHLTTIANICHSFVIIDIRLISAEWSQIQIKYLFLFGIMQPLLDVDEMFLWRREKTFKWAMSNIAIQLMMRKRRRRKEITFNVKLHNVPTMQSTNEKFHRAKNSSHKSHFASFNTPTAALQ